MHQDNRGDFREWFRADEIKRVTRADFNPVQANVSRSAIGVIRGIHFSPENIGQAKFITCIQGKILDVVVDLRPESPTFKQWESIELSSKNGQSVYIQGGLGHAFQALEEMTYVSYLQSSHYTPSSEFAINPNDPELNIHWPVKEMNLSYRDQNAPLLRDFLNLS